MENNDSFFDLELGEDFSRKLLDFSNLTDIQETVAALDAQIVAFRDQPRSETWAKAVIGFRQEITTDYSEILKLAKEKMLLLSLYHEANAYLENLETQRIAEAKAEEERKIAEAKAEENRRIAAIKAEEQRKFAEAKAQEEQRKAEERAKEEQRKAEDKRNQAKAESLDSKIVSLSQNRSSHDWETAVKSLSSEVESAPYQVRQKMEKLSLLSDLEAAVKKAENTRYQQRLAREREEQRKAEERDYRLYMIKMIVILSLLGLAAVTCLVLGLVLHSPYLVGCAITIAYATAVIFLEDHLSKNASYDESMMPTICSMLAVICSIVLCFISRAATIYAMFLVLGCGISLIILSIRTDGQDLKDVYNGLSILSFLITVVILVVALWMVRGFKDFVIKDGVLKNYNGRGEIIVTVPDGVTSIGKKAFAKNKKVQTVILPDSVTEIESHAFKKCKNLKNVKYGDHVEYIASDAFAGTVLDNIYVGKNITTLDFLERAKSITLSPENTYFHKEKEAIILTADNCLIWAGSTGEIPENATSIGPRAFAGVSSAVNIVIGGNIRCIEANTFSLCQANSIVISDTVKSIEAYAFADCETEIIKISQGVEIIEKEALAQCGVVELTVPFIGCEGKAGGVFGDIFGKDSGTFGTDKDNKGNRIPDSLKKVTVLSGDIFENSFYGLKHIEEIVLLHTARIEAKAFYHCKRLSEIYISSKIEYIGASAFFNFVEDKLTIFYEGTEAEWQNVEKHTESSVSEKPWNKQRDIQVRYEKSMPDNIK